MKKFILMWLIWFPFTMSAQTDIYSFTAKDIEGKDVSFGRYKGQVLLIVNTATRCGFTSQYKELQALYEKYGPMGFIILDFPCNQFGEQAPGSIAEIHAYCTANFDIRFPQFDKIDVNGKNELPLYTYLKRQKGFEGFDISDPIGKFLDENLRKKDPDYRKNPDIKWNFTKFLIDKQGKVVKRFEPTAKMIDVEVEVKKLLSHGG